MSFNSSSPPDWLMPEGVSKTQWEYISNQYVAANYDSSLKDNPAFQQDLSFLEKHFTKAGIILDLGCGTGRVADFLTKKNHKVLGIDLSDPMLLEASNKKIIAVTFALSIVANFSFSQVKFPRKSNRNNAPTTPTAAASSGVENPKRIEPSTAPKSNAAAHSLLNVWNFADQEVSRSIEIGARPGKILQTIVIDVAISTA